MRIVTFKTTGSNQDISDALHDAFDTVEELEVFTEEAEPGSV